MNREVTAHGALFLVGVYFELWPRYRTDVWSAGALCAIALGNSHPETGVSPIFSVRF